MIFPNYSLDNFLDDDFIVTDEIKESEADIIYIFKQIKELVEEEVKRSRNLILKFDESDMDCRQTKMATFSFLLSNRICI